MKLPIGPGAMVAAAFIGPGTVTACTVAGADFGYALVWALVFATVSTLILQDMAARLGAGARLGLGEALMRNAGPGALRWAIGGLIFIALALGNAAYEGGNLAGGALGMAVIAEGVDQRLLVALLALVAGVFLFIGRYKLLERVLIALVILMSLAFIATAILVRPDFASLASGLVPGIPDGGLLTAIALIGTTIVPYNLFLHAAAARNRWSESDDVKEARTDTGLSIGLGGLVSILILTTAAGALFGSGESVQSAAEMARGLEPVFGMLASYLVGIGLFAAGLTSAITAPMATAYALTEMVPAKSETSRRNRFRTVALAVLVIGAALNLTGATPVSLILVAQVANGLLLPVIAGFLLYVMNRKSLLGEHANGPVANVLGWAVVALTFGLGLRLILRALGVW